MIPAPIDALVALARRAGAATLPIWQTIVPADATAKADGSPLTAADLASHRLIVDGLQALTPQLPVLSEESAEIPVAERCAWPRFWLVDPLDGTKEFLARGTDFTVNIAFIDRGEPVFGVIDAPALGTTWWGGPGQGAWISRAGAPPQPIAVTAAPAAPWRVVASRRHRGPDLDAFLAALGDHTAVDVGSSLKFCLVAEGRADLYPRSAPTMEWDTGAGHAILLGAGGALRQWSGGALRYGRENLLNPAFIAGPTTALLDRLLPV